MTGRSQGLKSALINPPQQIKIDLAFINGVKNAQPLAIGRGARMKNSLLLMAAQRKQQIESPPDASDSSAEIGTDITEVDRSPEHKFQDLTIESLPSCSRPINPCNPFRTKNDETSKGASPVTVYNKNERGPRSNMQQNARGEILSSSKVDKNVPLKQKLSKKEVQAEQIPIITEMEAIHRTGTSGREVSLNTNFIRLNQRANTSIFEYDVLFDPTMDSRSLCNQMLSQHKDFTGDAKIFDGKILSLPFQTDQNVNKFVCKNPADQNEVIMTIVFRRMKSPTECSHFYNKLFDCIMKILKFVRFNRKQFNPTEAKILPVQKLEVWPGFVTSVSEVEGGLMLCMDVSHRVLSQVTVLEKLHEIFAKSKPAQFQQNAKACLLNMVVITRYNNRTYRIDDVKFDGNPTDTFDLVDGTKMSYSDYYKKQHNITIHDLTQPLLVSVSERLVSGKSEPETVTFVLIPELSHLTGFTDEMANDFQLMREISAFTRVSPNQRVAAFRKFCRNIRDSPEASKLLKDWGLSIDENFEIIRGRQLNNEIVRFANGTVDPGPSSSFRRGFENGILDVVDLNNWVLIFPQILNNDAQNFLRLLQRVTGPMGMEFNQPQICAIPQDRNEEYVNALRKHIVKGVQIVAVIVPSIREDRYAAIKKMCCAELPIPTQVITRRVIGSTSKSQMSVVQNIALQMNCKMGGALWSVDIPLRDVMICGIDTYHEAGGASVAAFVASTSVAITHWYSRAIIQHSKEEFLNGIKVSMIGALGAYQEVNGCLPKRIMVFRDGVSDGQLDLCVQFEIPQLKMALRHYGEYQALITFVVVQKRINARFFLSQKNDGELSNPNPGCVVDHTITRKYMYDFFLVSQKVNQGTVSPTHYIVLKDECNYPPDVLQRLAYKMTFLYYNWPGSLSVPACCQYAHKMAFLIGKSVRRQPAESLCNKLFYL